jgi:hypothetical protein
MAGLVRERSRRLPQDAVYCPRLLVVFQQEPTRMGRKFDVQTAGIDVHSFVAHAPFKPGRNSPCGRHKNAATMLTKRIFTMVIPGKIMA